MSEGEPLVFDSGITRISDEIDENVTSRTVASGGDTKHGVPEPTETNGVSVTHHSDTLIRNVDARIYHGRGAVLPISS